MKLVTLQMLTLLSSPDFSQNGCLKREKIRGVGNITLYEPIGRPPTFRILRFG